MTYSYDKVVEESTKYFNREEFPARNFADKYALRNENNELIELTPDDMHRRLAKEFARIEKNKFKNPLAEEEIYSLFKNYGTIIPQGSPIFGIGNPFQYVSISNCFVVEGPEDSYAGILKTDEELAQISKRRGGVGTDISKPRPIGTPTRNSSKSSTGTISWMQRYSNTIREVGQDGRRGALMLTISVHHPDVIDFSTAKSDKTKVTGANISIKLSDEFLNALSNNEEYEQRWPIEGKPIISKRVLAKNIWQQIIHNAWADAEPGLLFWDNILKESIADCYSNFGFKTISTNPCGELPLPAYDSCRLMAINLFSCVVNPFEEDTYFDFRKLYEIAQIAQRLMDDLVDLEIECIDRIIAKIESDPESQDIKQRERSIWYKIREMAINGRRTGLGITALGDTIAAIGLKYGSDESIEKIEEIYKTLKFGSYRSSVDMAKELGAFPIWDWNVEKENPFLNRIKDETIGWQSTQATMKDTYAIFNGQDLFNDIQKYGRRNIANLTTAPTGTISTQAGMFVKDKWFFNTTSGIEPNIFISSKRRKKVCPGDEGVIVDFIDITGDSWMTFDVYHSGVKAWMYVTGKTQVDETCPYFGATANDINWIQRVKLQAAAQKHVDHSISSTVNLPSSATEEDISKIYETAWKSGCKGITVYRDGCRSGVILDASPCAANKNESRPKELPCDVHHVSVQGKSYFVLVGKKDDDYPYEVFAGKNGFLDTSIKSGKIIKIRGSRYKAIFEDDSELVPITATCEDNEEAITRLISTSLRSKAQIPHLVKQLEKVGGDMTGFARGIARVLKKYIPKGTKVEGEKCKECKQETIIYSEGCKHCSMCGASKCG